MADIFGSVGGNPPIQEDDRLEVRVYAADSRDSTKVDESKEPFPSLTLQHVQSCVGSRESALALMIDVSVEGELKACTPESLAEVSLVDCSCAQLVKAGPAKWLAGKRWSLSVGLDRKSLLTTDRRLVLEGSWNTYLQPVKVPGQQWPLMKPKVEDPSLEGWNPGADRLATACFADAFQKPTVITSRWAVWFDAAGSPTKVLEQKGYPPLPKPVAQCVARALKTAQSPCPSRAGLWAMADLRVNARDPKAPAANPFDGLVK